MEKYEAVPIYLGGLSLFTLEYGGQATYLKTNLKQRGTWNLISTTFKMKLWKSVLKHDIHNFEGVRSSQNNIFAFGHLKVM